MSTPPEQPPQGDPEVYEVYAVLGLLLIGATLAETAAVVSKLTKIPPAALRAALLIQGWRDTSTPQRPGGILDISARPGTAESIVQQLNTLRQAAYTVKSGRRIQQSIRDGYTPEEAAAREMRHFAAHWSAINRRNQAAQETDRYAQWHGDLLGWYATVDGRTTPDCRRANGANFKVTQPPAIGYPGAVHPYCRCVPGPPHNTRRMV